MGTAPVVAGVDGTTPSRAAVLWAANYAEALALPMLIAYAGDLPGDAATSEDPSTALLLSTVSWLRREGITCAIEATVRCQSPESMLVGLSHRAAALVVGDVGDGAFGSLVRGSVGHYVAGHAQCPVVVVPSGWADRPDPHQPVVAVGVSTSAAGCSALDFAVRYSAAIGGRLQAVRCVDPRYPRDTASGWDIEGRIVRGQVADALHRCGVDGLDVTYDVRRAPAITVLHDLATEVDLMVLGSRYQGGRIASRLGAITSRLARRPRCPISVVGPAGVGPALGLTVGEDPRTAVPAGRPAP